MAENSKIEWCHHTVNLWWGCTEVHSGCDNCYARILANRYIKFPLWGNDAPRLIITSAFKNLAKFQKKAAAANEIHSVFINSMSDLFEKEMVLVDREKKWVTDGVHDYPTFTGALRDQLFEEISAGMYPNLLFLLLTKRPSNINKMIPKAWKENPPNNVMFGTSPVDQKTADTLIPQLLQVKGYKFLSIEPQLAELSIKKFGSAEVNAGYIKTHFPIHWVINGGESGQKKRPFNTEWARKLMLECQSYSVPFFMKQIDKVQEIPEDLMIREFPNISE